MEEEKTYPRGRPKSLDSERRPIHDESDRQNAEKELSRLSDRKLLDKLYKVKRLTLNRNNKTAFALIPNAWVRFLGWTHETKIALYFDVVDKRIIVEEYDGRLENNEDTRDKSKFGTIGKTAKKKDWYGLDKEQVEEAKRLEEEAHSDKEAVEI